MQGRGVRHAFLVEDDELYARAMVRALASEKIETEWVRTWAAAMERLSACTQKPWDYAIVDDRLPDGYGLELLHA